MSRRNTAALAALVAQTVLEFGNTELTNASLAAQHVVACFLNRESMTVRADSTDGRQYRLHGNVIAEWRDRGRNDGSDLWIQDAGWPTLTTRGRLRLMPGVVFCYGYMKAPWRHKLTVRQDVSYADNLLNGRVSGSWGGGWTRVCRVVYFGDERRVSFPGDDPSAAEAAYRMQADFRRGTGGHGRARASVRMDACAMSKNVRRQLAYMQQAMRELRRAFYFSKQQKMTCATYVGFGMDPAGRRKAFMSWHTSFNALLKRLPRLP